MYQTTEKEMVKERLMEYIRYKKIPVKQFEEKSSLSNGYVSSMRKGFGTEKLENVLKAFPDLNRDWLLYGEGEMIKADTSTESKMRIAREAITDAEMKSISTGKVVPYYDAEAAAGTGYNVSIEPANPIGTIDVGGLLKDSDSALRVYGNSMIPNYPAGCVLGLKLHTDRFIEPGSVYVIETQDNRYLKRVYYNEDKTAFQCLSDNHMIYEEGPRKGKPYYPEFEIPMEDVRRLFRVVGVIKRNIL